MADQADTRIPATWVGQQSADIVNRLNERVAAGTLESWRAENPG